MFLRKPSNLGTFVL